MYNEGFTSLKNKNYVEGKNNKYDCHGNQDCYLSPFHKEKTTYRHWTSNSFITYHLNMINSNLQHKYVYLKQICDIFIK